MVNRYAEVNYELGAYFMQFDQQLLLYSFFVLSLFLMAIYAYLCVGDPRQIRL